MRIIHENLAIDSVISLDAGTESSDYPLANLVNGAIHPEARITSDGSGVIRIAFDLGSAVNVNGVVAILGDDILADASGYSLRRHSSDAYASGTDLLSTSETDTSGNYLYGFDSAESYQYWWLTITGLTASTEFIIPEVWLVNNSELSRNIVLASANVNHGGKLNEAVTDGGVIHTKVSYTNREFPGMEWQYLNSSELATFTALHDACFGNKTFWLFYDDDDPAFCYYQNKALSVKSEGIGYFSIPLKATEVPMPNFMV